MLGLRRTMDKHQIVTEAAKGTPPVLITAWHALLGLPLEKWLTILTLIYVALQIVVLVRKEFIKRKGRK